MARRVGGVLVVVAIAALVGGGCSARKHSVALSEDGAGTVGEERLSPESESSLARARAGKLEVPYEASPLRQVYFPFNSFELNDEARGVLQANARWLNEHAKERLEIEGHCDERGTVEYNLALGVKRAAVARKYLIALGVEAERITTISYGEELPVCRESTESCWQRCRRARFVLLGE